jgi:hypothetical protein
MELKQSFIQKDNIKIQAMNMKFLRSNLEKMKEINLGMRQLQKVRGCYGCLTL